MAGFRNGRGRDNRTSQQHPQRQQQQQPYGRQAPPQYGRQQWPQAGGPPPGYNGPGPTGPGPTGPGPAGYNGEPEYFGDPYQQPQHPGGADPYANNPGNTQAFSINDDQYGDGATYRAGAAAAPSGPRLGWRDLLSGIVTRPSLTFLQMRDYPVWGPALTVTFLYGLLALFGFDTAREDAISATLSTAIPYVLTTAVAFMLGGLILGVVTHTLARQLGGDGAWQPTVGLSMLIMSLTDTPRLIFGVFLGGENSLVQVLGWLTWIGAGALFTVMVSKSHDLPWPKALGASAIELIALLSLIKLGTL